MANMDWRSPASSASTSVDLTASTGSTPTTPPTPTSAEAEAAALTTFQIHHILFHEEKDLAIKWQSLTTKAPFPVTKVLQNKAIVDLLLPTEPGPKVDYERLRTNLNQLRPYVIKTPSGPSLLSFFGSLFIARAHWLNAAARLEAFRSHDRTLYTYYVEWHTGFQQNTAGRALDKAEITYDRDCQEHATARMAGEYARQEDHLMEELETKAMELVKFKTSQTMWKYSRIFWAITEQYQRFKHQAAAAALQKRNQDEEMKRKTEEILRRREEIKKYNEEVRKRQLGMQLQKDANKLFMQQSWE